MKSVSDLWPVCVKFSCCVTCICRVMSHVGFCVMCMSYSTGHRKVGWSSHLQNVQLHKEEINFASKINPAPAEPGYTLT